MSRVRGSRDRKMCPNRVAKPHRCHLAVTALSVALIAACGSDKTSSDAPQSGGTTVPSSLGGGGANAAAVNTSGGTSGTPLTSPAGKVAGSGGAVGATTSTGGASSSTVSTTAATTVGGAAPSAGGATSIGTSGASGGGSVFPQSVTKPRIMIVGDSVSASPGCYKKYLLQNLKDNGITNYEFVGEYADQCGSGVRHSAVGCATAKQYTLDSFTTPNCAAGDFPGMAQLMKTHAPDMVMIQLGVNDVWSGNTAVSSVLATYEKLVQQARAANPKVVVFVAQIHKIKTENCTNEKSYTNAESLVKAVPDWTKTITLPESPVFPADLWTNSDETEAADCVHPNTEGAKRMGQNWFDAIKAVLN